MGMFWRSSSSPERNRARNLIALLVLAVAVLFALFFLKVIG